MYLRELLAGWVTLCFGVTGSMGGLCAVLPKSGDVTGRGDCG
jgi:hypothetical protein